MRPPLRAAVLLFLLLHTACSTSFQQEKYTAAQYSIRSNDTLAADKTMNQYLLPYRDSVKEVMKEVVGYSTEALTKGLPESTLGNFVADACLKIADSLCIAQSIDKPDFAMLNSGGLRNSLPAGAITLGNIYELMPFENELVIINLNQQSLDQLLKYIATRKGNPVSGIRLQLADSTVTNVRIRGKNLQTDKTFRLLTSDYLANGGDNMSFLKELQNIPVGIKIREAILAYLQQVEGDTLKIRKDGRIYR